MLHKGFHFLTKFVKTKVTYLHTSELKHAKLNYPLNSFFNTKNSFQLQSPPLLHTRQMIGNAMRHGLFIQNGQFIDQLFLET